jgi:hypothetical protein
MKTLQECKQEVAEKYGRKSFYTLLCLTLEPSICNGIIDEAAELYASQFKSEPDDLHSRIMAKWKNEFGSIHKDVTMDAYTVSGFIKGVLDPNS